METSKITYFSPPICRHRQLLHAILGGRHEFLQLRNRVALLRNGLPSGVFGALARSCGTKMVSLSGLLVGPLGIVKIPEAKPAFWPRVSLFGLFAMKKCLFYFERPQLG